MVGLLLILTWTALYILKDFYSMPFAAENPWINITVLFYWFCLSAGQPGVVRTKRCHRINRICTVEFHIWCLLNSKHSVKIGHSVTSAWFQYNTALDNHCNGDRGERYNSVSQCEMEQTDFERRK